VRKQEKVVIWPAYFDQSKTRKDGRRVSKSLSLHNPKIDEVELAVKKLGLKHEVVADASYPKTPWIKTGMILVEKQGSKEQVIQRIAGKISKIERKPPKKKRKKK